MANTEIAKATNTVNGQNEASFLAVIERVSSDPNVDVSKFETLMNMQERIMAKNAEIAFNQAMARLQPKLPVIEKTAKTNNSFYAKYEDIDSKVRPLYTEEGFSVSFTSKRDGETITYFGTLKHSEGHSITAEIDLPADTSGSKNAVQAKASTLTYAKRYLLTMLLNIVTKDEDTDGAHFFEEPVDEAQLGQIMDLCDRKGIAAKQVCEKYGVKSLNQLSQKTFIKAYNTLNARPDVKGKKDA